MDPKELLDRIFAMMFERHHCVGYRVVGVYLGYYEYKTLRILASRFVFNEDYDSSKETLFGVMLYRVDKENHIGFDRKFFD